MNTSFKREIMLLCSDCPSETTSFVKLLLCNDYTPLVNYQLSGVIEGSSQMNTGPAAQMSPGPRGGG